MSTGTRGLCYPAEMWEAAQQARASYRAGFWATHPVSSPLVQRPRAAEGGHYVLTQEALILLEEVPGRSCRKGCKRTSPTELTLQKPPHQSKGLTAEYTRALSCLPHLYKYPRKMSSFLETQAPSAKKSKHLPVTNADLDLFPRAQETLQP